MLEEMKVRGGRSTTKEENMEDERGREQIIQGVLKTLVLLRKLQSLKILKQKYYALNFKMDWRKQRHCSTTVQVGPDGNWN